MSRLSFWAIYFAGLFFTVVYFWYDPLMIGKVFCSMVVYSLILIASVAFFFDDREDEEEPKKFVNCGRPECAKCTSCKGCSRH